MGCRGGPCSGPASAPMAAVERCRTDGGRSSHLTDGSPELRERVSAGCGVAHISYHITTFECYWSLSRAPSSRARKTDAVMRPAYCFSPSAICGTALDSCGIEVSGDLGRIEPHEMADLVVLDPVVVHEPADVPLGRAEDIGHVCDVHEARQGRPPHVGLRRRPRRPARRIHLVAVVSLVGESIVRSDYYWCGCEPHATKELDRRPPEPQKSMARPRSGAATLGGSTEGAATSAPRVGSARASQWFVRTTPVPSSAVHSATAL